MAIALALLWAPANASAGSSSAAAFDALQASLEELVAAETGPPGASALVQRNDDVRFLRAGSGDLRTGRAFHRTDHMRIASTSKAFSGAVALSLADQGVIGLDDTIGELLPGQPPAWSQVTLAQLMHHTSGIPSFTSSQEYLDRFAADPRGSFTPPELVAYVADEPLRFEPGTDYYYSNTDNILIGLIAEAATGRIYQNDLRQLVFRPLGLRQTSLPTDWLLPRRYIHGYDISADAPPEDISEALSMAGVWASGGIVSTPVDLTAFIRGYGAGALFGPAIRKRQFDWVAGSSDPPGPGVNSAGLSIFRYRTGCGTVYGHTGNFPGYTQLMATTKNGRRSLVVSVNEQLSEAQNVPVFDLLLAADEAAVCAALSGRG